MNSKDKLLREAIKLSVKQGYRNIKREDIAQKAGISAALINFYYGTIQNLQKEVMRYTVKNVGLTKNAMINGEKRNLLGGANLYGLLAQGLALRDPIARKAPQIMKESAAHYIAQL